MKHKLVLIALTGSILLAGISMKAEDKKAEKPKPYALKTCLVTGEKLGEMGKPFVIDYKGQEVKFCCKGCEAKFKKTPDVYLKKLKDSEKKDGKTIESNANEHAHQH